MTYESKYICPRCAYPLIPVHAVEGSRRRIIALTCPEPYCDHMQMVTRGEAKKLAKDGLEPTGSAAQEAHG